MQALSRDRGIRLQNALAAYLRQWWVHAESAGSGRNGRDVLGTPGVAFECKTGVDGEHRPGQFMRQAVKNSGRDLPVVVWFPPGIADPSKAIAMLPLDDLMCMMVMSGDAPAKRGEYADDHS